MDNKSASCRTDGKTGRPDSHDDHRTSRTDRDGREDDPSGRAVRPPEDGGRDGQPPLGGVVRPSCPATVISFDGLFDAEAALGIADFLEEHDGYPAHAEALRWWVKDGATRSSWYRFAPAQPRGGLQGRRKRETVVAQLRKLRALLCPRLDTAGSAAAHIYLRLKSFETDRYKPDEIPADEFGIIAHDLISNGGILAVNSIEEYLRG